jgi:hypothetical protein
MENGKKYVIMTSDGPIYQDVFLSWRPDGSYFTTVDELEEINESDFHSSVDMAESRAEMAHSSTLGGWEYPMFVMEIVDFDTQELKLIKQVNLV